VREQTGRQARDSTAGLCRLNKKKYGYKTRVNWEDPDVDGKIILRWNKTFEAV
jgi:hypothetical protein